MHAAKPQHTIILTRLPLWNNSLKLITLLTGALGFVTIFDMIGALGKKAWLSTTAVEPFVGTCLCLCLMLGICLKRFFVRQWKLSPIVMHDDHMLLPKDPESLKQDKLLYRDIIWIESIGQGIMQQLLIESKQHVFYLPYQLFADPEDFAALFQHVCNCINLQPQGLNLLQKTQHDRMQTMLLLKQKPWATHALCLVIAVLFLNIQLKGDLDRPTSLIRWGANVPLLVQQGEWWRLIMANFLHNSLWHAVINGLAIYYLGRLIERLLGWQRFIVLYTGASLCSMIAASYTNTSMLTIGSSGAIFGLFGSFAVINWRLAARIPVYLRQPRRFWVFMIVISTFLPVFWTTVDVASHVVSVLYGLLLTLLYIGNKDDFPSTAKRWLTCVATCCMILIATCFAAGIYHASQDPRDLDYRTAQQIIDNTTTSSQTLSSWARTWLIHPGSTPEDLHMAANMQRLAIARNPNDTSLYSLMAQLAIRQKNDPEAIEYAAHALLIDPNNVLLATQLAHFFLKQPLSQHDHDISIDTSDKTLVMHMQNHMQYNTYAIVSHESRAIALVHIVGYAPILRIPLANTALEDNDITALRVRIVQQTEQPITELTAAPIWHITTIFDLPSD